MVKPFERLWFEFPWQNILAIVDLGVSDISMIPVLWKHLLYFCAQCPVVHVYA